MKIETILLAVLGIVFLTDFILKGIKKNNFNNTTVTKQTEEKKSTRNITQLLILELTLGTIIGYFIDYIFNDSSIHNYFFKKSKYLTINLSVENLINISVGFLLAYPITLFISSEYFKKRRKNTVLFLFLTLVSKVLIHYSLYQKRKSTLGEHFDVILEEKIWLFVPTILIISFFAWFFNDKIKAR